MEGWNELIERDKYVIEYGLHCSDMTKGEMEDDLCFAIESFANKNGLSEIDWESI